MGNFIVVSIPSSIKLFFMASEINISLVKSSSIHNKLLSLGLCAISLTNAEYTMSMYEILMFSSAFLSI